MVVYLLKTDISGEERYKIGFTRRGVKKRVAELKTGNSYDLELVLSYYTPYGAKVENMLHRHYKEYNCGGEWFLLPPEEVDLFLDRCILYHENVEILETQNTYNIDKNKK